MLPSTNRQSILACSLVSMALLFSAPIVQAAIYELQPGKSRIVIHVYKGGALKILGHNHIISTYDINGTVNWDKENIQDTRFTLTMPVESFRVDDPTLRRRAGKKFTRDIGAGAKKGTRKNMLGKKVLDVLHFPQIVVRSRAIQQTSTSIFNISIELKIHGVSKILTVPVVLKQTADIISVKGEFTLLQSDYGIKPLRAAFGSIVINDRINIYFRLIAEFRRRISSVNPENCC